MTLFTICTKCDINLVMMPAIWNKQTRLCITYKVDDFIASSWWTR